MLLFKRQRGGMIWEGLRRYVRQPNSSFYLKKKKKNQSTEQSQVCNKKKTQSTQNTVDVTHNGRGKVRHFSYNSSLEDRWLGARVAALARTPYVLYKLPQLVSSSRSLCVSSSYCAVVLSRVLSTYSVFRQPILCVAISVLNCGYLIGSIQASWLVVFYREHFDVGVSILLAVASDPSSDLVMVRDAISIVLVPAETVALKFLHACHVCPYLQRNDNCHLPSTSHTQEMMDCVCPVHCAVQFFFCEEQIVCVVRVAKIQR